MDNKMNRRSFIGVSSMIGAAGLLGGAVLTSCARKSGKLVPLRKPDEYYIPELPDKAIEGRELKVGLIGCGGRGRGRELLNVMRDYPDRTHE